MSALHPSWKCWARTRNDTVAIVWQNAEALSTVVLRNIKDESRSWRGRIGILCNGKGTRLWRRVVCNICFLSTRREVVPGRPRPRHEDLCGELVIRGDVEEIDL